jgi:hypothetical protein
LLTHQAKLSASTTVQILDARPLPGSVARRLNLPEPRNTTLGNLTDNPMSRAKHPKDTPLPTPASEIVTAGTGRNVKLTPGSGKKSQLTSERFAAY